MDLYDDEDIATMATAASINDLPSRPSSTDELEPVINWWDCGNIG